MTTQQTERELFEKIAEIRVGISWYKDKAHSMGLAALHHEKKVMLDLMRDIAVDYGKQASEAIRRLENLEQEISALLSTIAQQGEALEAAKALKYFSYDEDDGFRFYQTLGDARDDALGMLKDARESVRSHGEWHGNEEKIMVGAVIMKSTYLPDGSEGNEVADSGDFQLRPAALISQKVEG